MQEASETQFWLEFSREGGYSTNASFEKFYKDYEEIIDLLNSMEINSKKI